MTHDTALEVRGLSRSFGPRRAVANLSMTVPTGCIYGFLGPNGSGKTTAIRCILGLIRADAGEVAVFGERDPVTRLRGVGALVETPRFHGWLSGRANLEIACSYADLPPSAADEALDRVGLGARAQDAVAGYSLGMQQRLGIARALLGRPRLLILDEPTNGLDPQGMRDVRELLRALARPKDTTIVLSSHLLHEVQAVADRVAIVQQGRLLAEGEVSALLGRAELAELELGSPDPEGLTAALAALGVEVQGPGEAGRVLVRLGTYDPAGLNAALVARGVPVSELVPRSPSLEDLFLQLTRGGEIT